MSKAEIKAQQERANWIGLAELAKLVQSESDCSVKTAREQIRAALADGAIWGLDWEPAPPESDYCSRRSGGGARIPTARELLGSGEPGCPPPTGRDDRWVDHRSASHWQTVEIDWALGRVFDDFERDAHPKLLEFNRSTGFGATRRPKPRKAEWRTLRLYRAACERIWGTAPPVSQPKPSDASPEAHTDMATRRPADIRQAEASLPEYQLVSDVLLGLIPDGAGLNAMRYIEYWVGVFQDEWRKGNIEMLLRMPGEEQPRSIPCLGRKLEIEPDERKRSIRCVIRSEDASEGDEFEDPYIMHQQIDYLKCKFDPAIRGGADSGTKDESASEPDVDVPIYRTGLAGRPTSWHLVAAECRRRYEAGERRPNKITGMENRAEWSRVLAGWLETAHSEAPALMQKTLSNKLSSLLRELQGNERAKT